MRALFGLICSGCCLPVPSTERPALSGVVYEAGQPLPNAVVEACTWSTWGAFACPHPVRVMTDEAGRYRLPAKTTFPTILLGEAPLNETIVTVCSGPDLAMALVGSEPGPLVLDLTVGGPLQPIANPFRTPASDATRHARARCPR